MCQKFDYKVIFCFLMTKFVKILLLRSFFYVFKEKIRNIFAF